MAAVEVEKAVVVAILAVLGVGAERGFEVDELHAGLVRDGLMERFRGKGSGGCVAVIGGEAGVDLRCEL